MSVDAVSEAVPERSESAAGETGAAGGDRERREVLALLASIFLVAACGLVYELLIATVSSYQLGNSVTQFSLSVGLFVGSMGLGSWISQRINRHLLPIFIFLELVLGAVGGLSATLLFAAYAAGWFYHPLLYGLLVLIGTLVGVELPLLVRMLNPYGQLRTIVAQALSFDYLGCLVGSLAFPLLLLPQLGLERTAYVVGLVNVAVAAYALREFRDRFPVRPLLAGCGAVALVLAGGLAWASQIHGLLERSLYQDEVIYARRSRYQAVVFTRWRDDLRLFLDGNLQFSSVDEHRYHEALVHPVMSLAASRRSVLLLGAGDGLAVREILRHEGVERITLVDLDPEMTRLGRDLPALRELNRSSLHDPRVRVVNTDAHRFLESSAELYDLIIADLPDPNGDALAKLYSVEFYRLAHRRLARGGAFVTQSTSPFFSREAFWSIARSMEAAGFRALPYHAYVPSFGQWGFILGADRPLDLSRVKLPPGLRYLTPELLPTLTVFDPETAEVRVEPSTIDHPRILRYYLDNSREWE
ncbi:MAG: polyamine aminopropyltransferase [Armatimonadota bacterium]